MWIDAIDLAGDCIIDRARDGGKLHQPGGLPHLSFFLPSCPNWPADPRAMRVRGTSLCECMCM